MSTSPTGPLRSGPAASDPWAKWGWLMAAVWLVFLIYPGISLTESVADEIWVIAGWFGLIAFAVAYICGFVTGMRGGWRAPTRAVIALFFMATGCALLTIPAIGWGAASFLPFLMAYAAYGIGSVWHWATTAISILVITAYAVAELTRGSQPPWILIGIVMMMAVVNTINTWLIGRSVAEDDLRMELATSEERETIARDVHDVLGHSLTVVKLKAQLAARLIDRDPTAARAELDDIARITGEAIASVRSTVTGIRAHTLEEQLRLSHQALSATGVRVRMTGSPLTLSPAQSIPAAWILREATTNILRHAEAAQVTITIEPGELTVEDDGVGVAVPGSELPNGNGVRGMRERASAAGATFTVTPALAGQDHRRGTKVRVIW